MSSLSFDFQPDVRPLAARLRPVKLEHYIGQQHLLGQGTPLRQAIEAGREAFLAGRMPRRRFASASSPLAGLI